MPIQVNKVTNANIYLDGDKSLIGRAAEVTLPDIEMAMNEHTGLGMVGSLELPQGLNALTMSVKWNGFYAEHLRAGANPFASHSMQVRASVETYGAAGRVEERPVVWLVTASWKKTGLGAPKPKEAMEFEDELAVSYIKTTFDGEDVMEIDVLQNIWNVNGEDILKTWRQNLGA